MTTTFGRVAVLGLGLIGGSLLHAIKLTGVEVIGYDIDPTRVAIMPLSGSFPIRTAMSI